MKKSAVFILVLLSNFAFSCGFHIEGEEIRFHLLKEKWFGYQKFSPFYYSWNPFGPSEIYNDTEIQPNEALWKAYCKNQVSAIDVGIVMDKFSGSDINEKSTNSFLQYLYKTKDTEAIEYLKFAKECELFNSHIDDPWERNENRVSESQKLMISKALQKSETAKKTEIKERYAFLAIRMAYYCRDFNKIKSVYQSVFENKTSENIISIWAMYFRGITEKNNGLKNFYLAQVFSKSPEKRFVCWQHFSSETSIENTLKLAKTPLQKSNIYQLYSVNNPGKNYNYLSEIYRLDPKSDALSFLLLREMTKLEDWIFTPYYTLFDASGEVGYYDGLSDMSTKAVFQNIEKDRKYAEKLLEFINAVDLSEVENPLLWKIAKGELLLMMKKYKESQKMWNELEHSVPKENPLHTQIQRFKAICLVAEQSYGNAKIPDEVKSIVLENRNERKFLFALGRELEYLGNFEDAAYFYASVDAVNNTYSDDYEYEMYYKSLNNRNQTYSNLFYDYFDYIDAVYSPQQTEQLIAKIERSKNDDFYQKLYSFTDVETQKLRDLVGMKYLRENNLNLAFQSFKKAGKEYYNVSNSLWERTDKTYDGATASFSSNPFYTLEYTPDFIEEQENIPLNKMNITQKLIEYINKANNPNEINRDYYYFLVANCYYNMGQFGNVWKMKRYFKNNEISFSVITDTEEFNSNNLAKSYYQKAFDNAKTPKFRALCLRMMGRCENNAIDFQEYQKQEYYSRYSDDYYETRFRQNKSYHKLKSEFSKDYDNLMSGCDFFKEYFNARR